jgi:hypothetical protein
MRGDAERRVRELARRTLPFLVPVRRRYVEWSYETRKRAREQLFNTIYRSNHSFVTSWTTCGGPGREFLHLDITTDRLPKVDAILCRDCLVHCSFRQIAAAVRNFRRRCLPAPRRKCGEHALEALAAVLPGEVMEPSGS